MTRATRTGRFRRRSSPLEAKGLKSPALIVVATAIRPRRLEGILQHNPQMAVIPLDSRGVGHDRVLERLHVQRDWHLDNKVSRAAHALSSIPTGGKCRV